MATIKPGFGSGSTAIAMVLHESKLYVANVGDSRFVMFSASFARTRHISCRCVLSRNGVALALSTDHTPLLEEERLYVTSIRYQGNPYGYQCRRIEAAGGYVVQGRVLGNLNLSRAIGGSLSCLYKVVLIIVRLR